MSPFKWCDMEANTHSNGVTTNVICDDTLDITSHEWTQCHKWTHHMSQMNIFCVTNDSMWLMYDSMWRMNQRLATITCSCIQILAHLTKNKSHECIDSVTKSSHKCIDSVTLRQSDRINPCYEWWKKKNLATTTCCCIQIFILAYVFARVEFESE